MLKFILQPSKATYSWGSAQAALVPFLQYGLYTFETLKQLRNIDVEGEFRSWYPHGDQCERKRQLRWQLSVALAMSTDEYLDDRERSNTWSAGLLPSNGQNWTLQKIERMIDYATNTCLAITKLARFIRASKVSDV